MKKRVMLLVVEDDDFAFHSAAQDVPVATCATCKWADATSGEVWGGELPERFTHFVCVRKKYANSGLHSDDLVFVAPTFGCVQWEEKA